MKNTPPYSTLFETLLTVITLLLIFIMAARTPLDSDMWWHLRAGQQTIADRQPLLKDIFSSTRYGAAWINHSWLAQVILYELFRLGNYFSLGLLVAILATFSLGLVFLQMRGNIWLRSFILIIAGVLNSFSWSPRPQIFSLALLALLTYLFHVSQKSNRHILWLLPPIFALWGNLHGGYPLGLLYAGTYLLGSEIDLLLQKTESPTAAWKSILRRWTPLLVSLPALLINPNGFAILTVPFQTVGVQALGSFIQEWASPDFHETGQLLFLCVFLLGSTALIFTKRKLNARDFLPYLAFAFLAFSARRNIAPFVIGSSPFLFSTIDDTLSNIRLHFPAALKNPGSGDNQQSSTIRAGLNLFLVALLALMAFSKLYIVTHPAVVNKYLAEQYPVRALEYLSKNKPSPNLFNDYNWGGYITWTLPGTPVFIDGRTDLYGDEIIRKYMQIITLAPGWQTSLQEMHIATVLLPPSAPLTHILPYQGWQKLYSDNQAVIYSR